MQLPNMEELREARRDRYDQGYKYLLSDPETMHQLLRGYVNEEEFKKLPIERFRPVDTSFTDAELQATDGILYGADLFNDHNELDMFVYVFIESVDEYMTAFRVVSHITCFYQHLFEQDPERESFPPVFPIVFYTGSDPWMAPLDMYDLIEPHLSPEYEMSCRYYPIIVRDTEDETMRLNPGLMSAVMYMEKHRKEALSSSAENWG